MIGDVEVHYNPRTRTLGLECSSDAFESISKIVVAESGANAILDTAETELRLIQIFAGPYPATDNTLGDRLTLCGWAVVCFVVMSLLALGLKTVVDWLGG